MATQSSRSFFEQEFTPARLTFGAATMGGATALAAALFTTISPLGGAIFGVTSFLGSRLIHWISDKINCLPESPIFRIAQYALAAIGGIATAALVTTALGFPVTVATATILTVASIGIMISSILALGGCVCSSAIVTGIALRGSDSTTMIHVRP
jgi:hypothetical protein